MTNPISSPRKSALVTGASRGIGAAVAKQLAKDGFDIWLNYHSNHEAARRVQAEIEACGAACTLLPFDVADAQAVRAALNPLLEKATPYALVNNAGIALQKLFCDLTPEDWRRVLSVDLDSVFCCCKAVAPRMAERSSGSIVNVSSMWGQIGGACEVAYSAAKAGVLGLTKALAKELSLAGVRVNCICPGVIDTGMNAPLGAETLARLAEEIPLQRLGTAEEVAEGILYLAEASYVTGQVLGVNGGFVI